MFSSFPFPCPDEWPSFLLKLGALRDSGTKNKHQVPAFQNIKISKQIKIVIHTTERGESLRFTCGSLCCHLNSHWPPWRYSESKLAISALLICCQNLLLVKPRFYSLRVYSSPLLTCSLFTSQQHCRSSCLNHICSLRPGLSRELCSICSGVISGQPQWLLTLNLPHTPPGS